MKKYFRPLIAIAFFGQNVLFAAESAYVTPLTLEAYTKAALNNSLRSQTALDTYSSARYGWTASKRALTWPTLSASAAQIKDKSDTDTGIVTNTRTSQGSLTLNQPLLTGTQLAATSTWSDAKTDTDTSGVLSNSRSKLVPNWTASLTQPIFIFVQNPSWRSWKQSRLRFENDQDTYNTERLNIEFDAHSFYYSLLLQEKKAQVERMKYESAQQVHRVTQALVHAGKLAEVELARADIRAKQDQRRIQNALIEYEKAMNSAKDFIYLPANATLKPTSPLTFVPLEITLDRLVEIGLDKNPALRSARRDMTLAEMNLHETKEGNRPRINAVGSYTETLDHSSSAASLSPFSWELKLGLDWPLFDATQTHLRSNQSELSLINTRRAYENQTRQLKVNIQNAYLEVKRTEEQITDFDEQLNNSKKNVNAIRLQYRNGLSRLIDVFDAENEARDLELEYLNLLVSFNTAKDQLSLLVGEDITKLTASKGKR